MVANRAYTFRIYPNDEQKILFAKTFGCVRMVYNHWLDRKIRQYEENKTNVTYTICAKEIAAMKKTEEYRFLKEIDSIALQQSLRHLDTAFQNFFKQPKTGFPRFKSKRRNKNSYSTVCINGNITLSNGYLRLPKIGQIRLKQHRIIPEEYRLKSVTVSQTPSGKYYASILFGYEDQVQEKELQKFLGLDFSMHEEEQGKKLVKVDRFFASSQTCSVCGYKNAKMKNPASREWDCPQCGTHHDRDVNAYVRKNAGLQTADIWYNKEDFVKEIIEQRNKNPERV